MMLMQLERWQVARQGSVEFAESARKSPFMGGELDWDARSIGLEWEGVNATNRSCQTSLEMSPFLPH
jgi:hypothetical protein